MTSLPRSVGEPFPALDTARLARELRGSVSGVEVLACTGSTNADAVARAEPEAWGDLHVLVAERQTGGRGRGEGTWEAPARAAVLASVLVRPTGVPAHRWPGLTVVMAGAVVQALACAGVRASVKWPNDVVVATGGNHDVPGWGSTRKVAGILAQALPAPGGMAAGAVVIGVGVNVLQEEADLPVPWATSVRLALGDRGKVDRTQVCIDLLKGFSRRYRAWISDAGLGNSPSKGYVEVEDAVVCVELHDGTQHVGRITCLDDRGGACVVLPNGGVVTVQQAAVRRVRRITAQPSAERQS